MKRTSYSRFLARAAVTLLAAFFAPFAMYADNLQVQVGDGTTQNYETPINLYYNYSYVQMVYTADQLSGTCNAGVNSISFYYVGTVEKTAPITVFMKNTTRTSFSSATDFEAVTASDIVYEGDWTVSTTNGWYTITLDTPFAYDGTNLLIAINKGYYSEYSYSTNFNHTATTNNQVLYARQDSGAYDPYTISTGTGVSTALPNILFDITVAHPSPTNVRVSDIGGNSANIVWDAPATNGVSYAYEYTDGVTIQEGTTTSASVNLTNLDPETSYLFEVKAVYADGESCAKSIEFETLEACPTPRNLTVDELSYNGATISWTGSGHDSYTVQTASVGSTTTETILSEGFEGGSMPAGWTRTGSYWTVTSGTGYNGYSGAATGSYNAGCYIGSYSGSDILVTPAIDLGTAVSATLSFNFWNTSWGGDINVLNVYYRVDEGDWNLLESYDEKTTSWEPVSISLEGLAAGYQIGFECESNYSYGMGIDDVEITAEVAGLSWTDYDTNASNPYTFNDLDSETTYRVRVFGVCGGVPGNPSDVLTFTTPSCASVPTNLAESNITTNSADLSWNGTSESFVLQYRPWLPAGEDVQPESNVLVPVTYDLSGFTGNGSVVIRHYNCYNQFALIVDNIVVTDANGTTVFSEDFENCGGNIPSVFTNMDMDGDGHVWEIAASPSMRVDGSYGLASYSYDNETNGILYPNNWLIINNIPMGGAITFEYCAQDADWTAENFCVYVSTENSIVEVPAVGEPALTATSYQATNLTPNTPYAWQVKGVCGADESSFASSFFQTLNDVIYFQTAGNWNDAANWDVNRVPTVDDKVQIDAAAVIPANVIAYAKTTTMGAAGSITIKDGGQLKQGTGTIDVTVEKTITGYGTNASQGGWHLIATPLSTTLFASTTSGWPFAYNLISDNYDLYSFDATQAGAEWYNYENNPNDFTKLYPTQGYLYANEDGLVTEPLKFVGTTFGKSLNNTVTSDVTYDDTSTDVFNGWKLVGNPFTCNAYLKFGDAEGNTINATFYKMNANGDGYEKYENYVMLAPGEGAFIQYSASGKVYYYSDEQDWIITSSGTANIPVLPAHGESTNQDANATFFVLHNNATNNSVLINALLGEEESVTTDVMLTGRTLFKDDNWNTICLPFDVTDGDDTDELTFTGTPLEGATAMTLTEAVVTTTNEETETREVTITNIALTFGDVTTLTAGTPYIIKWANGDNIVNPVFNDVTVVNTTAEQRTISAANEQVKFIGYYDALSLDPENNTNDFNASDVPNIYYMTSDNTLKYTGQPRTLKACRAYFDFNGIPASEGRIREFTLNFGDGETQGIVSIERGTLDMDDSVYDLLGRRLNGQSSMVNGQSLRKGLYIKNGRKVVIK